MIVIAMVGCHCLSERIVKNRGTKNNRIAKFVAMARYER
jgi:hypothetical protein